MKSNFTLNNLAAKLRSDWGEDMHSPINIEALTVQQNKITLIQMEMPQDMSGMCVKTDEDIIIAINTAMSVGRQRFTLAHELYHAYFDESMTTFVCMKNIGDEKADSEKEADLFASYFLVPPLALDDYQKRIPEEKWSIEEIVKAEQLFGISHQAMMVRLSSEHRITKKQYNEFTKIPVTKIAARIGFSKELYCNTVNRKPYGCSGNYIRKIEEAYKKELIGDGKRRELLMDGFADADTEYGDIIDD